MLKFLIIHYPLSILNCCPFPSKFNLSMQSEAFASDINAIGTMVHHQIERRGK